MAAVGQGLRFVETRAQAHLVRSAAIEGLALLFLLRPRALDQERARSSPAPALPQQIPTKRILRPAPRLQELLLPEHFVLPRLPYPILPLQRVFSAEKTR